MIELQHTGAGRSGGLADKMAGFIFKAMALGVALLFLWLLTDLVRHGLGSISVAFLTEAPRNAGREGGIGPIIVSTLSILGVCLATVLPLGMGTAVFLGEFAPPGHGFGTLVRRSLDVLAGVPSIVFGLFGNAFFCVYLGLGFSILSGGLTLACMVLPIFIRSCEEGLRAVPSSMRHAAAALGMSRFTTLTHILLPAALPGLAVGLVLGIGRALAETAALIFSSGYVDRMPQSIHDSGRSLSIHIYELSMNVAGGDGAAYGSALVLISMLLVINGLASHIAGKWLGKHQMGELG